MISKELLEAYQSTRYITESPHFEIIIGRRNKALDTYVRKQNISNRAFITAENPFSESLSKEENKVRNEHLVKDVKELKLDYVKGQGIPVASDWSPENSFLVLGISREKAIALAQKYKQNAFIYGEVSSEAELILSY